VGGGLIGAGAMAVLVAGLWLLNLLPSRQPAKTAAPPVAQAANPAPQPAAPPATLDLGQTQLHAGDFSKALDTLGQVEQANAQNPEFLAARGQALWLKTLQQLKQENKPLTKDELAKDENIRKATDDLRKADTPTALLWLGMIQEYTEGPDAARKTYEQAMAKHPDQKRRFQAALDRLDLATPEAPPGARLEPAPGSAAELYWMSVALLALEAPAGQPNPVGEAPPGGAAPAPGQPAPAPSAPAGADEEAGYDFWRAERLARENKYPAAIDALKQSRNLHDRLRYTRLGRAENPTSDPTEDIFLRACDELEVFWKVREKLAEAGYLDAAHRATQRDILAAVEKATKGEANVKAAQKTATELQAALKNAGINDTDPVKGVADLLDSRKKAEKKLDDVLAALKAAGAKADDPVKGVADLEASRKKEEKSVADVTAALETAGIKADDPVKGVAELEASKKAVQKKVDAVAAALKAAGIKDDDPVTGTAKAAAALGQSNGELDAMRRQLVARKYLPPEAKRTDVPAGLDHALQDTEHPLTAALAGVANGVTGASGKLANEVARAIDQEAQLTACRMDAIRLQAELADRLTPEQMLDVWLTALRDHPSPALADQALRDVRQAMKEKPVPAAVCVKALAERSKGQYAEARADLQGLLKSPPPPESRWLPVARSVLRQLTDPAAYYVPRVRDLRAEKNYDQALALLDQGLQVFSEDAYPGAHAALLALRSEVRLDQGRSGGAGERPTAALKASDQDARAAVTGGEKVEGNYAMGRVAETSGDLPRAEAFYRQSVEAYDEAAKDAAGFSKAHPASDALGNRYREALTRVLLEEVRQGKATPPRQEAPPENRKTTRLDADQVLSVVRPFCSGGLVQLACVTLALVPPAGAAVAPVEPPDPRLEEVLAQSDKMIAAGDYRGYLLKAEALGRLHRWADALQAAKEGVQRALPQQEAAPLEYVLENHPAFQRREGIKPPDPVVAEEHYETGLGQYFDGRYAEAERNFADAVYYNDQDARYLYFLGLARLAQPGKRDTALQDFRQAGRLEAQGRPSSAAVSVALERVQGPARHILNGVRARAIEEATAKGQ
jgi:tetratricopeptide (TPR) repeat protein